MILDEIPQVQATPVPPPDRPAKAAPARRSSTKRAPPKKPTALPATDLFGNPVQAAAKGADETPFETPPPPRQKRVELLVKLDEEEVQGCEKCPLHQNRTHTVFGEGSPEADLMFIGEGPGENEDLTGRPFVGKAGNKLDEMINALGLSRDDVYIANVVKCRPPGNRTPVAAEIAACTPYLHRQVEWIRPKVIVTLGLPATQHLLGLKLPMGRMRGQFFQWRGIDVMPTYHPAYLLRSYTIANRRAVWEDLQAAMRRVRDNGDRAQEDSPSS